VLVHCVDGSENEGSSSDPRHHTHPTVTASLIFAAQEAAGGSPSSFLYETCAEGLILRPGGSTKILCAHGGDAGSGCDSLQTKAPVGLYEGAEFPGDGCGIAGSCSWAPPTIHAYLRRVTHWQEQQHRSFSNDFVLDADHWRDNLPLTLEAFFGPARSYRDFLARYGERLDQLGVRVLHVGLGGSWSAPFSDVGRFVPG
jgi:hypothetical protein